MKNVTTNFDRVKDSAKFKAHNLPKHHNRISNKFAIYYSNIHAKNKLEKLDNNELYRLAYKVLNNSALDRFLKLLTNSKKDSAINWLIINSWKRFNKTNYHNVTNATNKCIKLYKCNKKPFKVVNLHNNNIEFSIGTLKY